MREDQVLDISWGTIFKIGAAILFFYLIFLIRDILIWLIFALIISILLEPAIAFLEKRKIPRVASSVLIYFLLFFLIGVLVYFSALPLFNEIQKITLLFPQYFEKIAPSFKNLGIEAFENFETFTKNFQAWLLSASGGILSAISSIFGGILTTLTIFTFSLFISFEKNGSERIVKTLLPEEKANFILEIWERCQTKVSAWFGVKILSCIFVGILTFIALKALKIDYAFVLAVLAGATNMIPILGPIFAGALMTGLALFQSLVSAVLILILFILIQQIENNILTPILSRKFIGMSPILVLVSLLIGGKLWGLLGAILAVPIFGIIFEFFKDLLSRQKIIT